MKRSRTSILFVFPTNGTLSKSLAWAAKLVALVALSGFCVCSAKTPKYDQTFRLGGLRIRERLKLFRARFPGAVCGTPLDFLHINRHTLDDPDNSGWVTCCVDDPKELSVFSESRVLSVDNNCPVRVGFYREQLHDIHFAVDVPSVESIFRNFVKVYGPMDADTIITTETIPVRFATWMKRHSTLELSEEIVEGDLKFGASLSKRPPEAKIVRFDMFEFGWQQR